MSAVTTLRKVVNVALTEAEYRVSNVLETTSEAVTAFVGVVFGAANMAAQQIVNIAFDLAEIVVSEAFNVAESVVTAALGDPPIDDFAEETFKSAVADSVGASAEEAD